MLERVDIVDEDRRAVAVGNESNKLNKPVCSSGWTSSTSPERIRVLKRLSNIDWRLKDKPERI